MCRNGTGPAFKPSKRSNLGFTQRGHGGGARRNGNSRRKFTDVRETQEVEDTVCIYPKEGGPGRSKRATHKHYRRQAKKGGFWHSLRDCEALLRLVHYGPVAWFRWVFLRLDEHDEACRWRRLVTRGG